MKKLKIKTVVNNINKGLMLKKTVTILLGIVFLNLHLCNLAFAQSNPRFYYYAYDEITTLQASNNKAVVKLVDSSTVSIESLIASSGFNPSSFQIETVATGTFIVSYLTDSTTIQQLIDSMKTKTEVHTVQPVYIYQDGLEMGITDEIVVKFKADVSESQIQNINTLYGVTVKKTTVSYSLLSVPVKGNALDVANSYQTSGLVKFAHPNFLAKAEDYSFPNDPYFVYQWYLHNTGQTCNDSHAGTADADVDAPEAWDITTGSNTIIIAVIDKGVTDNHPDLPSSRQVRLNGSNFAAGYDSSTDPNDPSPVGDENHGNACAGIIAAEQNNNEGVTGIAPGCKIMPIKISFLSFFPVNAWADAINFAWQNGADILSNSWGFSTYDPNYVPVIRQAIEDATIYGRSGLGTVVVFAAGNNADYTEGNPGYITFPANVTVPNVITVGASDRNDMRANYSPTSNPASSNNQIIDIVAPSHKAFSYQISGESLEVWSIDIPGNAGDNPAKHTDGGSLPVVGEQLPNSGTNFLSYTGRMGGTSAATPLVSGIAALMLSVNPCLTGTDVFYILTNTAEDVGGYIYTGGISNELGAGRVNANAAVSTAAAMYNTGVDLFMKDRSFDFGIEPNPDTGPMWVSEDIWVRNQNDGFTTQVHQNPEYSATFPNYVYVKIQNKGCEATLGTTAEQLELRWAKASTSLSWPDNWDGSVDLDPNPFVVALAGDIVSTQTIPIIQPGSFKILEFPWFAPDPDIYSGINTEPWHFCLLARILASNDPMASVETSDIYSNVRNNNNIVWKNLTVVDIFPYAIPTSSTMVRNGSDVITVTKLKFDNPEEEDAYPFLNYGSIKINLGHALFQKWSDGGRVGNGIEVCSDSIIHLLSPHSWIGNISLNPQEAFFIKAFFDLIIQPEECNFTFDISQYSSDSASGDKIIGGNRFILNTAIANAGKDTSICNGTNTTLTASGGMVYSWSTGETTRSITVSPNTTTTYTVTVSSSCGTASDDVTVTVNPNPAANAGIDQTICFGISDTLTASGGETYAWSTGATTSSINVSPVSTTTYTVTVTDANGCFATDDVVLTVNPLPLATITSFSNVTCNSEEDGSIDITVTDGTSPYSFNWSDGSVTEDISEISAGTYVVTVTDATGCTATNDITITEPLPVAIPPALYEEWVAQYNSIADTSDLATDITIYSPRTVMKRKSFIDGKGNIYVIGVTTGTTTDKDYVTIKYNSAGEEQWVRTFNGIANGPDIPAGIAVDNNSEIYVTGSSFGNGTNFDYATVKYDTNGTQQWVARYNSNSNDTDFAVGITVKNNFIYVTGYSKNSVSGNDFTTIKYNQFGVQQWANTYNGTGNKDDEPSDIAINKQGNIIITGSSDNDTNKDYVTIKYLHTGVQQWTARYNGAGNGNDVPKAIGIDAQNNIYITGSSVGIGSNTDFTTIKYNDTTGVQQWVNTYNGTANGTDEAIAIAIDKLRNIYVTGFSANIAGNKDYTTISYSSGGQSRWLQSYDGPANLDDYPTDIAVDKDNNVYVTGVSIYDPCTAADYTTIKYQSGGTLDWLQRYNGISNNGDFAAAIAIDGSNNVYVTGTSKGVENNLNIVTVRYMKSLISEGITIINGRLQFLSEEHFGKVMAFLGNKSDEYLKSFEQCFPSFSSLRKKYESSGLDTSANFIREVFTVLDSNGIFQVGKRIFKLDFTQRRVFVIPDGDESKIPYFNYKTDIPDIIVSTDFDSDYAWEISYKDKNDKCGDRWANGKDDKAFAYYGAGNNYRLDCKVVYQSIGVWFSLEYKVKNESKLGGVWVAQYGYLWATYSASWKKRCGATGSSSNSCTTCSQLAQVYGGGNLRPYRSTRALKYYSLCATFYNHISSTQTIITRLFSISDY